MEDDLADVESFSPSSSPGLKDDLQSPTLCAFVFRHVAATNTLMVGCALAVPRRRESNEDRKTHEMCLYQFEDSEFSHLESILVRACPSICHHPDLGVEESDDSKSSKLEKTLKHKLVSTLEVLGVESKPHKVKSTFDVVEASADLQALVGEEDLVPHRLDLSSPEWKLALQAATLLVRKESFLSKEDARGAFTLRFESLASYMRLDAAALTALNLLPSKDDKNKDFSVHGVLDKTVTKRIGSRLLTKWIRHPLVNVSDIRRRQDRVAILFNDTESRETLRAILKSVPDLDAISKRFLSGKGGLEDLYSLFRFAEHLPSLVACLTKLVGEEAATENTAFNDELQRLLELDASGRFGQYKRFVEDVLDLDLAPREFLIRAKHDETGELERLADERESIDQEMERVVKKLQSNELSDFDAKFEQDPKMLKTHGHHFRIPKKHDVPLGQVKGGKTLLVVQACIRWTTGTIENLSDRRAEIVGRQNQVQAKLVKEAMAVATTYQPLVDMSAAIVSELDVLASFAHVAATCPQGDYTRPDILEQGTGDLFLPSARHPCLELQPGVSFVANTHDMKRDASRFQILTGPNMGGKSTFARQLGVICVMAQIGSFVPCAEGAKIPVVDAVLARVGASDSQLRGISTFMAEMIEASNIVKTCTDSSLVIIDELGRGTSTYDGFGLAWAISEFLASERKSFVIFATHFHELTELANVIKGVTNLHVAAAVQPDGKVIMLHEVRNGQCDESFGVNIAKVAGFPQDVIDNAMDLLKKMDQFKGFQVVEDGQAMNEVDEEAKDQLVRKRLRAFIEVSKEFANDPTGLVEKARQILA